MGQVLTHRAKTRIGYITAHRDWLDFSCLAFGEGSSMRRCAAVTLFALMLSSAEAGDRRDFPTEPIEHLKPLEWLIGEWEMETPAVEAIPEVVEVGDPIIAVFKYEWGLGGQIIRTQWTAYAKGQAINGGTGLIGWAGEKKKVMSCNFGREGRATGEFVIEEAKIAAHMTGFNNEGEPSSAVWTSERLDPDEIRFYGTKLKEGDTENPDTPKWILKRVKK